MKKYHKILLSIIILVIISGCSILKKKNYEDLSVTKIICTSHNFIKDHGVKALFDSALYTQEEVYGDIIWQFENGNPILSLCDPDMLELISHTNYIKQQMETERISKMTGKDNADSLLVEIVFYDKGKLLKRYNLCDNKQINEYVKMMHLLLGNKGQVPIEQYFK